MVVGFEEGSIPMHRGDDVDEGRTPTDFEEVRCPSLAQRGGMTLWGSGGCPTGQRCRLSGTNLLPPFEVVVSAGGYG